jgi:opacity protein-like surface antigen
MDTRRGLILAALVLGCSPVTGAEEPVPPAVSEAQQAAPAHQQRVFVHGYISLAYANGDGHQFVGVPPGGTFDYRRAALLFRGNLGAHDSVVVQLAQRRLGESPAMTLEPLAKVDWAFYEHRFSGGTSVRLGRIPTPLGLYSEIRYVGTLLPFYRAPFNFYQEGAFTSENLNGIRISQAIAKGRPWSLELQAFGGRFSMIEAYYGEINRAHTRNAFGGQLWLNTPVDGLRFGVGGDFFKLKDSILSGDGNDKWSTWIASAEFSRTRLRLRSEFSQIHIKSADFTDTAFYVFGGVSLTEKLALNLQYDQSNARLDLGEPVLTKVPNLYTDTTVGTSYAFHPNLVAKAEYHWAKGRLIEDQPVPLHPAYGPYQGNYYIFSLSASF